MQIKKETIAEKNIIHFKFQYENEEDKQILDAIKKKGKSLADKVTPYAANNSAYMREYNKKLNDCISGYLAEYSCKYYLNKVAGKELCQETGFVGSHNQIDLIIKSTGKKIEIRSSGIRNGIDFAVNTRKMVGPYSNSIKSGEIQKDYYIQVIYPFDINELADKLENEIDLYIVSGATWGMMNDKRYSFDDDLSTKGSSFDKKSIYRVILIKSALDSGQIAEKILQEN